MAAPQATLTYLDIENITRLCESGDADAIKKLIEICLSEEEVEKEVHTLHGKEQEKDAAVQEDATDTKLEPGAPQQTPPKLEVMQTTQSYTSTEHELNRFLRTCDPKLAQDFHTLVRATQQSTVPALATQPARAPQSAIGAHSPSTISRSPPTPANTFYRETLSLSPLFSLSGGGQLLVDTHIIPPKSAPANRAVAPPASPAAPTVVPASTPAPAANPYLPLLYPPPAGLASASPYYYQYYYAYPVSPQRAGAAYYPVTSTSTTHAHGVHAESSQAGTGYKHGLDEKEIPAAKRARLDDQ